MLRLCARYPRVIALWSLTAVVIGLERLLWH